MDLVPHEISYDGHDPNMKLCKSPTSQSNYKLQLISASVDVFLCAAQNLSRTRDSLNISFSAGYCNKLCVHTFTVEHWSHIDKTCTTYDFTPIQTTPMIVDHQSSNSTNPSKILGCVYILQTTPTMNGLTKARILSH